MNGEHPRLGHYMFRCLRLSDRRLIQGAYDIAVQAHASQSRADGSPYISHPLAVAAIVAHWSTDPIVLATALLHDVLEDTKIDAYLIRSEFGPDTLHLVHSLTKPDLSQFSSRAELVAAAHRKLLTATREDSRVAIVKIADRLHNARTLNALRPEARARIANETREFYVPLATRFGITDAAEELSRLASRVLLFATSQQV